MEQKDRLSIVLNLYHSSKSVWGMSHRSSKELTSKKPMRERHGQVGSEWQPLDTSNSSFILIVNETPSIDNRLIPLQEKENNEDKIIMGKLEEGDFTIPPGGIFACSTKEEIKIKTSKDFIPFSLYVFPE
jgi:hypothetical protein